MAKHTNTRIHTAQVLLDSLSDGAVVLDKYGHAWQKSRGYWYRSHGDDSMLTSWDIAQNRPFKVIHDD